MPYQVFVLAEIYAGQNFRFVRTESPLNFSSLYNILYDRINFKKKYMPCVLLKNAKIFNMLPIKKHLPSIRDISGATFYDEYMLDLKN